MTENLEIYESETISAMIEFLYKSYRKVVMKYRFPFYIVQLIVYYATVMAGEDLVSAKDDKSETELLKKGSNHAYYGELVLVSFN